MVECVAALRDEKPARRTHCGSLLRPYIPMSTRGGKMERSSDFKLPGQRRRRNLLGESVPSIELLKACAINDGEHKATVALEGRKMEPLPDY